MRYIIAVAVFLIQTYPVFADSAYDQYAAMKTRMNKACQVMSIAARNIIIEKNSIPVKQAMQKYRSYGLPPMHVNVLDGFASMVYEYGLNPAPDEAATALYAACVMK